MDLISLTWFDRSQFPQLNALGYNGASFCKILLKFGSNQAVFIAYPKRITIRLQAYFMNSLQMRIERFKGTTAQ